MKFPFTPVSSDQNFCAVVHHQTRAKMKSIPRQRQCCLRRKYQYATQTEMVNMTTVNTVLFIIDLTGYRYECDHRRLADSVH